MGRTTRTDDGLQRPCRACGERRPIAPARARARDWICSRCANHRRDGDAARYLARKLSAVLRKRGVAAPFPGTAFARGVIGRCDGQSVLSGERDVRRLCIVQLDEAGTWTTDNAVLVTSAEGYALRRAATVGGNRQGLMRHATSS